MDAETVTCPCCRAELSVGDWPYCPHGSGRNSVISDDIPGGLTVENLGHEPVTVYSKSELLREARSRGLEPFVRHQPLPGSDKSPHTTDWSKGSIDPYTLAAAQALLTRQGSAGGRDPVPAKPATWTTFNVRDLADGEVAD